MKNALRSRDRVLGRLGVVVLDRRVTEGSATRLLGEGLAVGADEAVGFDEGRGGVELFVVGGGEVNAAVDAVEEEEAGAALRVNGGGEPDVVGDVGGGEVEGEALMDVEEEAAADFEVVEEMALSADEDTVLLVDPDGADQIAKGFLGVVVGFGVGVAGVVEEEGGAVVEVDAARIGEGAEFEDAGGGEEVVAAGVGFATFGGALFAMLFGLRDLLVEAVTFFLSFFGGKGFVVAGCDAVDANAVDGEAFRVGGGGLFEVAVAVEVLLLEVDVVGVVAVGGFGGALVAFHVEEEGRGGGEGLVGRLLGARGKGKEQEREKMEATWAHG